MTPKEKAIELIEKFNKHVFETNCDGSVCEDSRQCALICVDEIMKENYAHAIHYAELEWNKKYLLDWILVKEEIKKL